MSPLGTECLDIVSPPPGAREVMTQVERLSSRDTKIALRSVRIAACSCGRGKRACMVAPAWVVQHPHSAREQDATNRAHGIFGPGQPRIRGFMRGPRRVPRSPPPAYALRGARMTIARAPVMSRSTRVTLFLSVSSVIVCRACDYLHQLRQHRSDACALLQELYL